MADMEYSFYVYLFLYQQFQPLYLYFKQKAHHTATCRAEFRQTFRDILPHL